LPRALRLAQGKLRGRARPERSRRDGGHGRANYVSVSGMGHEHVAQPPAAVTKRARASGSRAKPGQGSYRRNLPHLQAEGKTFFVTFSTHRRWQLPESVRGLVLEHCLHDNGVRLVVHGVVVMPDHVHMVFTPLADERGNTFGLAEIMNGIKGASAHRINRALKRRGHVWQDGSFDHIL